MASGRGRRIASVVLGTLGLLLIFSAVLVGYTRRSLFNEGAFSARIAASLEDPHVARFAAEQMTEGLIQAQPDLIGLRPVLIGVCRSIVSTPAFHAAVRRGARALHRSIASGEAREFVLTVKDVGAVVQSAVASQPNLAGKIPPKISSAIGKLQALPGGERAARLVQFAHRVRVFAIAILFLGIGCCVASVWLASQKRRAILRIGIGLAILGVVLAIAARFGGDAMTLFMRRTELAPVIIGLARAFLGGLLAWAIGLGLTGLVLAAASASLLERVPLRAWTESSFRWIAGPQRQMRLRLLRGVCATVMGVAILLWPLVSMIVIGWLAGLLIAFLGLREAFVAALHLLPNIEPRTSPDVPQVRGRAVAFVSVLALGLISAAAWAILRKPDAPDVIVPQVTAYNGLPELGDRRLNQVVFPTTHNSMGGGDLTNWMFPNQSAGITRQLEDGIRGFLVDIMYGVPAGEHVKTEMGSGDSSFAKYQREVGPEGMDAAFRIRDRLTGKESGERDVYMCHGFCELGALKFVPALAAMRDFLVANPGEVLVIVLQDEGVDAVDIERCFEESGLIDFVYRGPVGPPWPTLREMVESDQRVLVMTENLQEGIPWCHPAFKLVQETPYTFHDTTEFSNKPNRGVKTASLYLMNHWIESTPLPKPSNASIVNRRDFLLKRIRSFQRQRGHVPNLVAVDFYQEGDLIATVRELNQQPLPKARRR